MPARARWIRQTARRRRTAGPTGCRRRSPPPASCSHLQLLSCSLSAFPCPHHLRSCRRRSCRRRTRSSRMTWTCWWCGRATPTRASPPPPSSIWETRFGESRLRSRPAVLRCWLQGGVSGGGVVDGAGSSGSLLGRGGSRQCIAPPLETGAPTAANRLTAQPTDRPLPPLAMLAPSLPVQHGHQLHDERAQAAQVPAPPV